jgi:hypothetical protein
LKSKYFFLINGTGKAEKGKFAEVSVNIQQNDSNFAGNPEPRVPKMFWSKRSQSFEMEFTMNKISFQYFYTVWSCNIYN